nr:hypothetical protein [Tanacetum cinerariifolium]
KNVATGANALPIPTCYDCGEQGHTRNQCPRKVKQEKVEEVHGRAYAIKDVEPKDPNVVTERVKVDAYIQGLTDNVNGEVTSSKLVNLNEAVCMAHKLMKQKLQAREERILEGKKQKWENFQSRNSSGKGNHRDNSRQTL